MVQLGQEIQDTDQNVDLFPESLNSFALKSSNRLVFFTIYLFHFTCGWTTKRENAEWIWKVWRRLHWGPSASWPSFVSCICRWGHRHPEGVMRHNICIYMSERDDISVFIRCRIAAQAPPLCFHTDIVQLEGAEPSPKASTHLFVWILYILVRLKTRQYFLLILFPNITI